MECLGYLEDILKAVKFLQSKGIVHTDIKGDNVLMEENRLRVKLIDFGSAQVQTDENRSNDIWKTGCLALEMLNGKRPPLFQFTYGGILQRQNSCRPEHHIPSQAMQEIKELLRFCFGLNLTPDQNSLPSATEILKNQTLFQ
ncbi:hypothetical protein OS493_034797 [Desmophyllum pertusum]|uniref:Protein kinase domain-containing protein n=1 Tax=Desmophyllum pertusum TaxID=174260 RepID=A0A9X0CJY5_9CNID|nr:hypothetical protein OS493_034797 [Desmophyllum pertusum]